MQGAVLVITILDLIYLLLFWSCSYFFTVVIFNVDNVD
jgi:hypothetical protein